MIKRGHGGGGGGHGGGVNLERWLVSYADFMTLLFCMFVLLYAMSKVDEQKMQEVAEAVVEALAGPWTLKGGGHIEADLGGGLEGGFGILVDSGNRLDLGFRRGKSYSESAFRKMVRKQMAFLKQKTLSSMAEVMDRPEEKISVEVVSGEGVRIRIPGKLAFATGEAEIQPGLLPVFGKIGEVLKMIPSFKVAIEGHTDSSKSANEKYPSNWELSSSRSINVLRYLLKKHHLNPKNLSVSAYAETRPLATNDTAEGREKNNRLMIIIAEPKRE